MEIRENIANTVNRILTEGNKTLLALSKELGIPRTSLENYAKGKTNLRSDTIELLAEKLEMTPGELISDSPSSAVWNRAKAVLLTARELSDLSPEYRDEVIQILLSLADVLTKASQESNCKTKGQEYEKAIL